MQSRGHLGAILKPFWVALGPFWDNLWDILGLVGVNLISTSVVRSDVCKHGLSFGKAVFFEGQVGVIIWVLGKSRIRLRQDGWENSI
jgi:hypothetical protein